MHYLCRDKKVEKQRNLPVILFCVLLLSGLDTFTSCLGAAGWGVVMVIGARLRAAGIADAATKRHSNRWSPGKGFS